MEISKNARGRPNDSVDVRISKTLSYILRHGAQKEGLEMRSDGFIKLDDLLQRPKLKNVTFEYIENIVKNNDKKRYQLQKELDGWYIRAVQGHTLEVTDLELVQIQYPTEVPMAIHGTTLEAYDKIKDEGLKCMKRQHIHLAEGLPGSDGVISGMRSSSSVFIYIDIVKALNDGIKIFKSMNGVILTSGIDGILPPQYFLKVENKSGEKIK